MNLLRYRPHLVVAASLIAVLAVYGAALSYIAAKSAWADEVLQTVEPRYARLLGLRVSAESIGQSLARASAILARHTYPASAVADRVGTDLQQRLRNAAEAAGVGVSGSQIVPGKADQDMEDIGVSMTLDADVAQLQAMLERLEDQSPLIYLDSISFQPSGRNAEGRLSIRARFSALRSRS